MEMPGGISLITMLIAVLIAGEKMVSKEFPYQDLLETNRKRGKEDPEYQILDTGIFDDNQYVDVEVTYAKQNAKDICIRLDIKNRYSKAAKITVLPTLWFYNRWAYEEDGLEKKPTITLRDKSSVKAVHSRLGTYYLYFQPPHDHFLTENETNLEKIAAKPNLTPFTK